LYLEILGDRFQRRCIDCGPIPDLIVDLFETFFISFRRMV